MTYIILLLKYLKNIQFIILFFATILSSESKSLFSSEGQGKDYKQNSIKIYCGSLQLFITSEPVIFKKKSIETDGRKL